jgi:uncharacterized protein (DUF2237 family)
MLRDDNWNEGRRPDAPRNVLGERLELCSIKPMTGFFRDGCCDTSREDIGSHTVCAVSKSRPHNQRHQRGNCRHADGRQAGASHHPRLGKS